MRVISQSGEELRPAQKTAAAVPLPSHGLELRFAFLDG
jgi:hypothetical protein